MFRFGSATIPDAEKYFKLHCAFRSGSNYLLTLLETNYDVNVYTNYGGWKHGPVPTNYDETDYATQKITLLLIVKEVLPWLVSMHAYAQTLSGRRNIICEKSWENFLVSPFSVTDGAHAEAPTYYFSSPVDYWNFINLNVLSVKRCEVVRYRDLLMDPELICEGLASRYTLRRITDSGEFYIPVKRVKRMADTKRSSTNDYESYKRFDANAYLNRSWLSHFSSQQIAYVEGRVDSRLTDLLNDEKRAVSF